MCISDIPKVATTIINLIAELFLNFIKFVHKNKSKLIWKQKQNGLILLFFLSSENDNPMISMTERPVVENRDTALVSAEQSSASSDNDNSVSEHLDDEYEHPYTTLVLNNQMEDEHIYLKSRHSTAFENVAIGRSSEPTEYDVLPVETTTHCYANLVQANQDLNDNEKNSKKTDNDPDRTFIHAKKKAEYINLLLKH